MRGSAAAGVGVEVGHRRGATEREGAVMIEPSGRSNRWRAVIVVLGCALVAAGAIAGAAEGRKPDATIELDEGSVGAAPWFSWEKGWLVYRGDRHPFRISGL